MLEWRVESKAGELDFKRSLTNIITKAELPCVSPWSKKLIFNMFSDYFSITLLSLFNSAFIILVHNP